MSALTGQSSRYLTSSKEADFMWLKVPEEPATSEDARCHRLHLLVRLRAAQGGDVAIVMAILP
jgi:hypothetical protein